MGEVSTIGLDIAKSVFQVHGVDVAGAVVIPQARQPRQGAGIFSRSATVPGGNRSMSVGPSLGRELQGLGRTVRLIPPSYVKAYLKRSKNDANDAAAICEAVTRPSMRFVPIKTKEQQTALMLHRTRQLLLRHVWTAPWQENFHHAPQQQVFPEVVKMFRRAPKKLTRFFPTPCVIRHGYLPAATKHCV
jgi:transposase